MRKQFADKTGMEKVVAGYEQEIRVLKESGNQFDRIARENLEKKLESLQGENARLMRQ